MFACAGHRASDCPTPEAVIELGSGTGEKTRHILGAFAGAPRFATFPSMFRRKLWHAASATWQMSPRSSALAQSYLDGMASAVGRRRGDAPLLVLFLGSTIGNFERRCARGFSAGLCGAHCAPGDALLIGADLVKDRDQMLRRL